MRFLDYPHKPLIFMNFVMVFHVNPALGGVGRGRDPLHNSCESVAAGSGWAARRLFAVNSSAIAKKNNAADRPSPVDHRPQGVMQRVPRGRITIAELPTRSRCSEQRLTRHDTAPALWQAWFQCKKGL